MMVVNVLMGLGLVVLCAACAWAGFHMGKLNRKE